MKTPIQNNEKSSEPKQEKFLKLGRDLFFDYFDRGFPDVKNYITEKESK